MLAVVGESEKACRKKTKDKGRGTDKRRKGNVLLHSKLLDIEKKGREGSSSYKLLLTAAAVNVLGLLGTHMDVQCSFFIPANVH